MERVGATAISARTSDEGGGDGSGVVLYFFCLQKLSGIRWILAIGGFGQLSLLWCGANEVTAGCRRRWSDWARWRGRISRHNVAAPGRGPN